MSNSTAPFRIVYFVSLFPCWSETFIVREINALIALGVDIRIVSLKPATEAMVQSDAKALLDRVVYHPPWHVALPRVVAQLLIASIARVERHVRSRFATLEASERPGQVARCLVANSGAAACDPQNGARSPARALGYLSINGRDVVGSGASMYRSASRRTRTTYLSTTICWPRN